MEVKKNTVKTSLFWAFLDQFSSKGIGIVVSIILARILAPDDFGMMGLIYFFTAISQELVDGGLSASLIRHKETNEKDYSTIFVTNVFVSLILYAILFLIAPYFASYYKIPELEKLLQVYGVIFIINALSNVQIALLTKELLFRKILLINLPGIIIGALLGVTLGYLGYGVWSIVYMQLVTQAITTVILWINNNKVRIYFSYAILQKHFSFGSKLMLSSIINAGFRNVSNLVVGKSYNVTDLGYFERARTLSMYPNYVFVGVLTKVFYPVFSKITDEDELTKAYRNVLNLSFYISIAGMVLLAVIAYPLFGVVLGEQWLMAVPLFQIFCLKAAIHPLIVFNLNILKVKGHSNQLFKIEIVNRIIGLIALFIGVYLELYWLVVLLTIADVIAYINNIIVTKKYHKFNVLDQIKDFSPTVFITILTWLICYCCQKAIGFNEVSWENLITTTLIFTSTFLGLSFILKNKNFIYLKKAITNKIND